MSKSSGLTSTCLPPDEALQKTFHSKIKLDFTHSQRRLIVARVAQKQFENTNKSPGKTCELALQVNLIYLILKVKVLYPIRTEIALQTFANSIISVKHCFCFFFFPQDGLSTTPTTLGRISSYYYLSHLTLRMFHERLHADCSLPDLIQILAVKNFSFYKLH